MRGNFRVRETYYLYLPDGSRELFDNINAAKSAQAIEGGEIDTQMVFA